MCVIPVSVCPVCIDTYIYTYRYIYIHVNIYVHVYTYTRGRVSTRACECVSACVRASVLVPYTWRVQHLESMCLDNLESATLREKYHLERPHS